MNLVGLEWSLHLQKWRVVEKDGGRSPWNRSIVQNYPIIWWPLQEYFLFRHIARYLGSFYFEDQVLQILVLRIVLLLITLL